MVYEDSNGPLVIYEADDGTRGAIYIDNWLASFTAATYAIYNGLTWDYITITSSAQANAFEYSSNRITTARDEFNANSTEQYPSMYTMNLFGDEILTQIANNYVKKTEIDSYIENYVESGSSSGTTDDTTATDDEVEEVLANVSSN